MAENIKSQILRHADQLGRQIYVSDEVVELLRFCIKISQPKKIVEIGTYLGYSALIMAESAPEDSKIYSFEKDSEYATLAKQFIKKAGYVHKVKIIAGDALDNLSLIESEPFDLLFIDANKSGYLSYLDWAERNGRVGSIIVADNIFLGGSRNGGDVHQKWGKNLIRNMEKFVKRLQDSSNYITLTIGGKDGALAAIKQI